MKNYLTLLTALIFSSLLFQGCEEPEKEKHPPVIGSATSITVDDKQAQMAPSAQALNELSNTIATILKVQLDEIAQKEAENAENELRYCDISGLKQWVNGSTLDIKYEACKTEKHTQNGELKLTYGLTDSEGQYPQTFKLVVKEAYTFNDIVLQKELIVKSSISYNDDNSLNTISFKIDGLVNFDHQTIKLKNYPSTVKF